MWAEIRLGLETNSSVVEEFGASEGSALVHFCFHYIGPLKGATI